MENIIKKFFSNGLDDQNQFNSYHGQFNQTNKSNSGNSINDYKSGGMVGSPKELGNPNIIPNLYHNPNTAKKVAQTSPFMNLNSLSGSFPTFDTLLFNKKAENVYQNKIDQSHLHQQVNLKLQMLEEKLRTSEAKRNMLDSINKTMIGDNKSFDYDPFESAKKVLKEIQEEIVKQQCKFNSL